MMDGSQGIERVIEPRPHELSALWPLIVVGKMDWWVESRQPAPWVDEYPLSTRARLALAEFASADEVRQTSDRALRRKPNLGPRTLSELREVFGPYQPYEPQAKFRK